MLAAIKNGTRFISFNIVSILDTIKPEKDRSKRPDLESFSLKECCDEVLDFLDLNASQRNVGILLTMPENLDFTIRAAKSKLQ